MPSYKVENGSGRDKAIKVFGGTEVVKRGKTATLENAAEMTEAQIADFAAQGVKITEAGKASSSGDAALKIEVGGKEKPLKKATKDELEAYAKERFDVEIDKTKKVAELAEEVLSLIVAAEEDEDGGEDGNDNEE